MRTISAVRVLAGRFVHNFGESAQNMSLRKRERKSRQPALANPPSRSVLAGARSSVDLDAFSAFRCLPAARLSWTLSTGELTHHTRSVQRARANAVPSWFQINVRAVRQERCLTLSGMWRFREHSAMIQRVT